MRRLVHPALFHLYIEAAGSLLALLVFLSGWKARVIRANFRAAGWEYSRAFRWRLCRNLCRDLMRFLSGCYGRTIRLRPLDVIKYKELRAKGGLLLVAHFHNWEHLGGWLCAGGMRYGALPLVACAKPLANPWADAWLARARARLRLPTLARDLPRRSARALESGRVVAFLWDQRPEREGFPGTLLGREVRMNPLPAFLAGRKGVPIYFGTLFPDGQVRLTLLGYGPLPRETLARRYHRVLQLLIARHPAYWYGWTHRRFARPGPRR